MVRRPQRSSLFPAPALFRSPLAWSRPWWRGTHPSPAFSTTPPSASFCQPGPADNKPSSRPAALSTTQLGDLGQSSFIPQPLDPLLGVVVGGHLLDIRGLSSTQTLVEDSVESLGAVLPE